uniref:hypothetical protein n=1 Tax=Hymenobacter polaris TaxID=2682546 RepID=UPI00293C04A6|nr:hypothetical protein [Hymenobacter polaris]
MLALRTDGTLWAWGYNLHGQVGDNTTTSRFAPVLIGTATSWQTVVAYGMQSAALRADGTLWVWGNNQVGQLGDGTTTPRIAPVQLGAATTWQQVVVGEGHSLATRADGSGWAWGANGFGQLGDGTTTARSTPGQNGTSGWQQLSAGTGYSAAIKADGTLWAWGRGALGKPTYSAIPLLILGGGNPLAVRGGASRAVSVSVAPNPAHEEVQFPLLSANVPVQVLDVTGRLVRAGHTPSVSVRGLVPGLYLVQVLPPGLPPLTTRLVVE